MAKKPITNRTCGTCRFWDEDEGNPAVGLCRGTPPSVTSRTITETGVNVTSQEPVLHQSAIACGLHQTRKGKARPCY